MNKYEFKVTKGFLAFLGLMVVGAMPLAVYAAKSIGGEYWEVAHLVIPYSVLAVLSLALFLVAIIGMWMLVSKAEEGDVYGQATRRWLSVIQWSLIGGVVIPLLVAAHLLFIVQVGGPPVLIGFVAAIVVAGALYFLFRVIRKVYENARDEHEELSGVI